MTDAPGGALVEVAVDVGAEHAELASFHVGEFSPGGFVERPLEDGSGATRLSVYLPVGQEGTLASWLAANGVPVLSEAVVTLVPADWTERWKEFHRPVVVGDLWVGPPWQEHEAPRSMKRVVIEPAQGFGTGAHPTTQLVLALLQEQPRSSVLDVGCGSGVLAVAAAVLGFGPVAAFDNDPVAVDAARDNLTRNGVRGIDLRVLDALQGELPTADLVLANVLLEPLVRLAPRMRAPRLILSGLLRSQADACAAAYTGVGYVVRERRDRDGWSALVLDDARDDAAAMRHRSVW